MDVEVGEETHGGNYSIIGRSEKQNLLSEIEGALHFFFRLGGDAVCVDHRGPDVRMAQERLDRAEVVTCLKQVRGI
jgi:hypothetical protein